MAQTKKSSSKAKSSSKKSTGKKALSAEEKAQIKANAAQLRVQMEKKKKLHDEIWAIIIIAIGAFFAVSLHTQATGAVGNAAANILFGFLGKVAYGMPWYLMLFGILIFCNKTSYLSFRSVICCFFLFVFASVLAAQIIDSLDLSQPIINNAGGFFKGLKYYYSLGKDSAGIFGAYFGRWTYKLIGEIGLYILTGVGAVVMLIFIVDTPVSVFFDNLKLKSESIRQAKAEHAAEAERRIAVSAFNEFENIENERANKYRSEDYTDDMPKFPSLDFEDKPSHEFTPEDIGLGGSSHMSDDRKKILSYVNDDDILGGGKSEPVTPEPPSFSVDIPQPDAPHAKHDDADSAYKIAEPGKYKFPPVSLLKRPVVLKNNSSSNLAEVAQTLERTLRSFDVSAKVTNYVKGPAVTRFEVQPAPGVKVSKIVGLKDDIALNLRAKSIRIEAPIPGKAAVGIEISNDTVNMVCLRELIESDEFRKSKSKISVGLGKNIAGNAIVGNIKDMPHLLIAGTTGSGKSVCINSIIVSLLYKATPEEVKLILVDPKVVELSEYNGIPHLMVPVVTDPAKASAALGWAVTEMDERYNKFAEEGVRDLESYNETVKANGEPDKVLPQVVIIIDEMHDLMMAAKNQIETYIARLAAKARAAGMHLIVATQRPSVNVITGVIKANIPSRIAFAVGSQIDSRTILDTSGAESLVGKGDMLYAPQGASVPERVQGCFVSDEEVHKVIEYVKQNSGCADYHNDLAQAMENAAKQNNDGGKDDGEDIPDEDEFLADAIEFVVRSKSASTSMLQRRFRIGYNRAARLMDSMEERGIISAADGARPRQVNLTVEQFEELQKASAEAGDSESF